MYEVDPCGSDCCGYIGTKQVKLGPEECGQHSWSQDVEQPKFRSQEACKLWPTTVGLLEVIFWDVVN